ncbi:MAG: ATP-binding protein [Pseudonocardiaceae bacterium]
MSADPSLAHLLGRLSVVEERVRRAVFGRRELDPQPDDPFRGLYLSEEAVERVLAVRLAVAEPDPVADATVAGMEAVADVAEQAGQPVRLRKLARSMGLNPLDVELLLVALAPDLDSRFEQLYGYLNDDVTRRRAAVGMALRLCGLPEAAAAGRARLTGQAPLLAGGLLDVEDPDRPLLSRALRVPDRVGAHLLGDDRPDPALATVLVARPTGVGGAGTTALAGALSRGVRLVYLRERPGGSGLSLAAAALRHSGLGHSGSGNSGSKAPILIADAGRLVGEPSPVGVARALIREARLTGAGVIVEPVEMLVDQAPAVLRLLAAAPVPVLFVGTASWDPRWAPEPPLQLDAAPATAAERGTAWRVALDGRLAEGMDPAAATAQFLLGPQHIGRAAAAAALHAELAGTPVNAGHLRQGAREQNAAGLERLARRIEPAVGWDDLVLPGPTQRALHELTARARHRDRVLDEWRMRPGGGRGRGITGLFAGDSGTGKTMSAEVIAADLGLDLYTVNLATVVDKYVGETEKNLERIFTEAAGVNGVLLFDEADAIFGKRSEVRDAHDRYANIESAYLLQRMESFDGLAILATNLRANLDDAFTRRLDVIVDFPIPDESSRRALWECCLGPMLPQCDDIDLDFCAAAFELSGGNIRSVAVTAAYLAAASARPLAMADLVTAVATEYRKLGRLCLDREFGPYQELVGSSSRTTTSPGRSS